MKHERLMSAFGFDQYDLLANRTGELTEKQRERVAAIYRQYRRGILPTFVIIGGMMVIGSIAAVVSGDSSPGEMLRSLPIVLLILVVLGGFTTIASHVTTSDVRRGRIRTAEGKAKLSQGRYKGYDIYRVRIGSKTFNLMNKQQFECFEKGEGYRVWYVRYWPDVILSIEAAPEVGW